jgi:hypothetical protein
MSGRIEPRTKCVLPVKVSGTDARGVKFERLACTLDISDRGARITGIPDQVALGAAIQVTYKTRRASFRVAWIGRPGTRTEQQIGVLADGKESQLWPELHKSQAAAHVDEPAKQEGEAQDRVRQARSAAAVAPAPAVSNAQKATERLKAATEEMFMLASLIERGEVDPSALQEFRHALGYVRNTSWMLQQWFELQQNGGERLPLLTLLNTERLRLAVSLCGDLAGFLATAKVQLDVGLADRFVDIARQLSVILLAIDRHAPAADKTQAVEAGN